MWYLVVLYVIHRTKLTCKMVDNDLLLMGTGGLVMLQANGVDIQWKQWTIHCTAVKLRVFDFIIYKDGR